MAKYDDIGDGWVRVPKRGFRLKCCGCGLIHEMDFRDLDRISIEIRMDIHKRATAAARRALNKGAK